MSHPHEEPFDTIPEWATVGTRAAWARAQAGLSVRQAAEAAKLSMGEVDAVEMDVLAGPRLYRAHRLREVRLKRLAPVYGVSLAWLRYGTVTEAARAAARDAIGMMIRAGTPTLEQKPVVLLILCQGGPNGATP